MRAKVDGDGVRIAHGELEWALERQEGYYEARSRSNWLADGDRNKSFFPYHTS